MPLRDHLLDLLRDRSQPLKARLRAFLLTAYEAQSLLDNEDMEGLAAFCAAPQTIPADFGGSAGSWEPTLKFSIVSKTLKSLYFFDLRFTCGT